MKNIYNVSFTLLLFIIIIFSGCKKDPCKNIICENGGICINGACDCETGYTGPSCANQITPTKIKITDVVVTRFPASDGGASWDIFDGPDIYFEIFDGSVLLYSHPTFIEDADPTVDYSFNFSTIDITDVTGEHTIQLMDYDDFSNDDFMGGIKFTPYNSTNGFPAKINLDAGAEVAFTLTVTYIF